MKNELLPPVYTPLPFIRRDSPTDPLADRTSRVPLVISFLLLIAGILLTASILPACKKSVAKTTDLPQPSGTDNCQLIAQTKITGARTAAYYTGDTIHLKSSETPDALYSWRQTNAVNDISNTQEVVINGCTKNDEGWYFLVVSYPDCNSHTDSVYIQVVNKPATAPCTPTNNTVSFSSIPSISFTSTTFEIDPSWNCKNLRGYKAPGYPDIDIYFNPYWNALEPEDGEYSVASDSSFPDNDPYTVFLTSTYSAVYFQVHPGKVYIAHVNGKLQVTFCSLTLSGSYGGTPYTTTASGMVSAP